MADVANEQETPKVATPEKLVEKTESGKTPVKDAENGKSPVKESENGEKENGKTVTNGHSEEVEEDTKDSEKNGHSKDEDESAAAVKRKSDVTDGKTESSPEKKAKLEESSESPTKAAEASA